MEVSLFNIAGLSETSIVSVRCAGVRRQTHVSKLRPHPLKFPSTIETCSEPLKLEVLEVVASTRLVLRPGETSYTIEVGSKDNPRSLGVHIKNCEQGEHGSNSAGMAACASTFGGDYPVLSSSSKSQDAAASARDYLEQHGLLRYIQALLHAVIQARPEDPFEFMRAQLCAALPSDVSVSQPQRVASDASPPMAPRGKIPEPRARKPSLNEPQSQADTSSTPPVRIRDNDQSLDVTVKPSEVRSDIEQLVSSLRDEVQRLRSELSELEITRGKKELSPEVVPLELKAPNATFSEDNEPPHPPMALRTAPFITPPQAPASEPPHLIPDDPASFSAAEARAAIEDEAKMTTAVADAKASTEAGGIVADKACDETGASEACTTRPFTPARPSRFAFPVHKPRQRTQLPPPETCPSVGIRQISGAPESPSGLAEKRMLALQAAEKRMLLKEALLARAPTDEFREMRESAHESLAAALSFEGPTKRKGSSTAAGAARSAVVLARAATDGGSTMALASRDEAPPADEGITTLGAPPCEDWTASAVGLSTSGDSRDSVRIIDRVDVAASSQAEPFVRKTRTDDARMQPSSPLPQVRTSKTDPFSVETRSSMQAASDSFNALEEADMTSPSSRPHVLPLLSPGSSEILRTGDLAFESIRVGERASLDASDLARATSDEAWTVANADVQAICFRLRGLLRSAQESGKLAEAFKRSELFRPTAIASFVSQPHDCALNSISHTCQNAQHTDVLELPEHTADSRATEACVDRPPDLCTPRADVREALTSSCESGQLWLALKRHLPDTQLDDVPKSTANPVKEDDCVDELQILKSRIRNSLETSSASGLLARALSGVVTFETSGGFHCDSLAKDVIPQASADSGVLVTPSTQALSMARVDLVGTAPLKAVLPAPVENVNAIGAASHGVRNFYDADTVKARLREVLQESYSNGALVQALSEAFPTRHDSQNGEPQELVAAHASEGAEVSSASAHSKTLLKELLIVSLESGDLARVVKEVASTGLSAASTAHLKACLRTKLAQSCVTGDLMRALDKIASTQESEVSEKDLKACASEDVALASSGRASKEEPEVFEDDMKACLRNKLVESCASGDLARALSVLVAAEELEISGKEAKVPAQETLDQPCALEDLAPPSSNNASAPDPIVFDADMKARLRIKLVESCASGALANALSTLSSAQKLQDSKEDSKVPGQEVLDQPCAFEGLVRASSKNVGADEPEVSEVDMKARLRQKVLSAVESGDLERALRQFGALSEGQTLTLEDAGSTSAPTSEPGGATPISKEERLALKRQLRDKFAFAEKEGKLEVILANVAGCHDQDPASSGASRPVLEEACNSRPEKEQPTGTLGYDTINTTLEDTKHRLGGNSTAASDAGTLEEGFRNAIGAQETETDTLLVTSIKRRLRGMFGEAFEMGTLDQMCEKLKASPRIVAQDVPLNKEESQQILEESAEEPVDRAATEAIHLVTREDLHLVREQIVSLSLDNADLRNSLSQLGDEIAQLKARNAALTQQISHHAHEGDTVICHSHQ